MSSAAAQGSSRARDDWTEAARRAYMRLESGREHHCIKIKCPGNLLLYLFLIELRSAMEAADADRYRTALFNIKRAKNDVLSQTYRLVNRQHIMQLSGCKDMLANIIERHLWTLYPPEPEDEEEMIIREQAQRAAQDAKKAAAAAKRQETQAAAAAAAGASGSYSRPSSAAAAGSSGVGVGGFSSSTNQHPSAPGVSSFHQPGTAAHDPLEELRRIFSRDPKAASLYEAAMGHKPPTAAAAAAASGSAAAAAAAPPDRKRNTGSSRSKKSSAAAAAAAVDDNDPIATAAAAAMGGAATDDPVFGTAAAAAGSGSSKRRGGSSKAKDYMPRAGTANYAFVISLYLAHRTGTPHMSKEQLIAAADASKLADIPIQGNNNAWAARQRGPAKWYDGWSNIKTLENRDVPLIQRWSNPVKIRLTAAGMMLGAVLYKHAVESGKVKPHEEVSPDEAPPPGSPTAAAGAAAYGSRPGKAAAAAAGDGGVSGSSAADGQASGPQHGAAAAAAAENGVAKKPRKKKTPAAAAATTEQESSQPAAAAAAAANRRPASSRPSSASQPGVQVDAAVAAAVAAAEAAAAAAASYGIGAAAAAGQDAFVASEPNWYDDDDDPCLAGDGYWGADDCYNIGSDGDCNTKQQHAAADQQQQWQQQQQQRGKRRSVSAGSRSKRRKSSQDGCGSSSSDGWSSAEDEEDETTGLGSAGAAAAAGSSAVDVDASSVAALVAMGFEQRAVVEALKLCFGSLLDAITYLTEIQPSQQRQQQPTQQSAAAAAACASQQQQRSQAPTQQSQAASQPAAAAATAVPERQPPDRSRLGDDMHHKAAAAAAAAAAGSSDPKCATCDDLYTSCDDHNDDQQLDYIDDIALHYHAYVFDFSVQEQDQQEVPNQSTVCPQQQQQQQTCDPSEHQARASTGVGGSSRGKAAPDKVEQHYSTQLPKSSAKQQQQQQQQQHADVTCNQGPSAAGGAATSKRGGANKGSTSRSQSAAAGVGGEASRCNSQQQPGDSTAAAAAAAKVSGSFSTHVGVDVSRARPWSAAVLSHPLSLSVPPLGPCQRFGDVYDVVLLIDQREQYNRSAHGRAISRTESLQRYAGKISDQGVIVDSSVTLACGDVLWVAQQKQSRTRYVLDFVAERKSYDDLSASIIDGRYSHQKWMMAGNAGLNYCLYLLEGSAQDLNSFNQVNPSKALACVTAMHRTLLHDGFKVLETGGPAESVDLLAQITKKLSEMYSPLTAASAAGSSSGVEVLEAWNARISNSRRTKTVRQKWQELLLSVSGIGVEAVQAVVAAYPTPISLFKAYESLIKSAIARNQNAVAAARALLVDVKLPGGQRLGPAKAKVVYDKLFMNGWNLAGE